MLVYTGQHLPSIGFKYLLGCAPPQLTNVGLLVLKRLIHWQDNEETYIQANTRGWPNVFLMLGQRRRCWHSIGPLSRVFWASISWSPRREVSRYQERPSDWLMDPGAFTSRLMTDFHYPPPHVLLVACHVHFPPCQFYLYVLLGMSLVFNFPSCGIVWPSFHHMS